ncbi:hypothetical protein GIV19_02245 [Pseudomonas syringae]|uniref:hypothetical protein n=1 Tax=Pseudomonas syringae TaxID=317 RepID=UPI001F3A823F|nr:hypothetical protein [Pseudomonas syringae]MCF5706105.1 hypothetical protein [Pseudomonas syringae]
MKWISVVKPSLARDGFAHYCPEIECDVVDEVGLKHEFDALEVDQFAPQSMNRFRRYANGFIMPWKPSSYVHWMPPVEGDLGRILARYDQGGNNPDHTNIRYFNSLSADAKNNKLLKKLILDDFSRTFWDWRGQAFPICFGVHFVKLQSHSPHDSCREHSGSGLVRECRILAIAFASNVPAFSRTSPLPLSRCMLRERATSRRGRASRWICLPPASLLSLASDSLMIVRQQNIGTISFWL